MICGEWFYDVIVKSPGNIHYKMLKGGHHEEKGIYDIPFRKITCKDYYGFADNLTCGFVLLY